MAFMTEFRRVMGLGSAKTGAEHWFSARVLSAALVPLTLHFLFVIAPLIGGDRDAVAATLASPVHASVAILFVLAVFKHLSDGLHEVLVDYVHGKAALAISLALVKFACAFFGAVGAVSIAMIAFNG